jgi:hypothetical protein
MMIDNDDDNDVSACFFSARSRLQSSNSVQVRNNVFYKIDGNAYRLPLLLNASAPTLAPTFFLMVVPRAAARRERTERRPRRS